MSDFITLSCPNCGGRLDVSPNTLSLLCQNCGTEHLVRRESGNILLEAYARCPVCNRNDRCEKLTKFSSELPKPPMSLPSQAWYLVPFFVWIPFWGQVPLWISPIRSKKFLLTLLVGAGYLLGFGIFGVLTAFDIDEQVSGMCGAIPTILIIGSLFVSSYYRELNLLFKDKKDVISKQLKEWESAKGEWAKLYYCHRDDCVYDPSTKKNVAKEKLTELLGISYEITVLNNRSMFS